MNPHRRYNTADEPLWLVIQRDDQSRCFEFPPNTHKAIVVGSSESADIRIRSAAPIAFFLERDGDSVWLIPAYPEAELRLDTVKVEGKRRIYTHGLVDIADVELRLRVRDTPPTLRGDGLVRMESEISDPMSKRASAAIDELAATTTIDTSSVVAGLRQYATGTIPAACPLPAAALPTKTIEVVPFHFDEWFEEAIAQAPGASVGLANGKTVESALTPTPKSQQTAALAASKPDRSRPFPRPPRPRIDPLDIKTEEIARIQLPPEPIGVVDVPSTCGKVATAPDSSESSDAEIPAPQPRLEPYRTIEIAPIRFSDPAHQGETRRPESGPSKRTTTVPLGGCVSGSVTTAFDMPVVKPLAMTSEASSVDIEQVGSAADRERRPIVLKVPTPATDSVSGLDPWFQEGGSERPVSTTSASVKGRLRSLSTVLEQLGLRAKRQPVLVFGGAAIGSLVLVLFFVAAAKMLGSHSVQKSDRVMAVRPAVTSAASHSESSKAVTHEPTQNPAASASTGPAQPPLQAEAKADDVPAAIAATPDVAPAVGHLLSGRLPEAEQAYRDLATKFPGEPAFQSAARILARKNSPGCRGTNPSKTACPSVKP